jgi:hypothetical protein
MSDQHNGSLACLTKLVRLIQHRLRTMDAQQIHGLTFDGGNKQRYGDVIRIGSYQPAYTAKWLLMTRKCISDQM